MSAPIQLIVGLGNPGREYQDTRHNAGEIFVSALARRLGASLSPEKKFYGDLARVQIANKSLWLLNPSTFMNKSGQAVAALANFYKIPAESILVAHDELDLAPGVVRLKEGGGHGGHNGLRDIIASLAGNKGFARLRIGVGHPGHKDRVVSYVLTKAPRAEYQQMQEAIEDALAVIDEVVAGKMQPAMHRLHS